MVDHRVFKYQVDQNRYFLEYPAHFRTVTRIQSALCQVYGIRQEYAAVEFEKVMGRWQWKVVLIRRHGHGARQRFSTEPEKVWQKFSKMAQESKFTC